MFNFIKRLFGAEPKVEPEHQDNKDQEDRNDKYKQGSPSDDGES